MQNVSVLREVYLHNIFMNEQARGWNVFSSCLQMTPNWGAQSVFKGRAATQKPYKIQGHVQSPAPGREVHLAVTHAGDCLAEKWPWALHKTIN